MTSSLDSKPTANMIAAGLFIEKINKSFDNKRLTNILPICG
jgi:hypothetical protein